MGHLAFPACDLTPRPREWSLSITDTYFKWRWWWFNRWSAPIAKVWRAFQWNWILVSCPRIMKIESPCPRNTFSSCPNGDSPYFSGRLIIFQWVRDVWVKLRDVWGKPGFCSLPLESDLFVPPCLLPCPSDSPVHSWKCTSHNWVENLLIMYRSAARPPRLV